MSNEGSEDGFVEDMEDMALWQAMQEADSDERVSKAEILAILQQVIDDETV